MVRWLGDGQEVLMFSYSIIDREKLTQLEISLEENIYFLLPFVFKVGIPSPLFFGVAGYFNHRGLSLKTFLWTL